MVEEKFKVGVEVEVEQSSLSQITRQIEKAVKEAFEKSTRAGAGRLGGTGKAPATPGGGAATARSIKDALSVSGKGLANEIQKAIAAEAKGFTAASKRVENAVNRLTKAIQARPGGGGGGPLPETQRLAARQQGPTNKNLARDIQKSRLEAGRQTTGSGGTSEKRTDLRTGTGKDRPTYQAKAEKREATRAAKGGDGVRAQQKRAAEGAKRVAESLNELRKRIETAFPSRPTIARDIGLPKGAEVGPGATIVLKDLAGQTKIVTSVIKVFGDKTAKAADIITERVNKLLTVGGEAGIGRVESLGRMARRRPEQATSLLRGEIRKTLELPVAQKGGVMQSYQKGGEAKLLFRPTKEQEKRLSKLKDEASIIAEVNKMLYEMSGALEGLKKQGIEVISSLGLSEKPAAAAQIIRDPETKAVKEVQMPVQTRGLAAMGLGGAGAMRQARSHLVTQIQEIIGGETPKIMGRGEREAFETGAFRPGAVRPLRTAVAGAAQIPEIAEDQILVDESVMMDIVQTRSKVMAKLAEGLQAGQELAEGQVLGADIEGGQVVFDAKGINAKIKEIEKIWEDGVEGVRVTIEEVSQLMTGEKITTMAGFKGIVKKVPDLAGKYGLPEGTQAAVSAEGMAKRGILRDPMSMMASEIAKQVGASGQEVADKIEAAMREGGQDIATAVEGVSKEYGLKGFTGAEKGTMVGELAFGRLPPQTGGEREQRFFDVPAIRGLEQQAETAGMAKDFQARMQGVMSANEDFIQQLKVMAGAVDIASEGLQELLPEQFKRLPVGRAQPEEFAGTILDPKYKQAQALRMPTREGGERLMRMPGIGRGLGQRAGFKTQLGLQQAEKIAKQFDRMLETATQIRAATGEIPLSEESPAVAEAANVTGRAMKDVINDITKLGKETTEGKAAMKEFIATFMPFVEQLKGAADIKYFETTRGGEKELVEEKRTAAQYVKGRRGLQGKMFGIQDILAERTGKVTQVKPETDMGKRGIVSTQSVQRLGAIHKNVEILNKVMEKLGVTLEKDSTHVERLHNKLEQLEEGLVSLITAQGVGRVGGTVDPRSRPAAQQIGGGLSSSEYRTALEFPTDVGKELKAVGDRLRGMRDAGKDVNQSLEALDRMITAQEPGGGIPKDVVVINRKDYERLVQSVSREERIPQAEAERRVQRPGLMHRFPTTGPASFLPTKLRVGDVPPGKMGVAGPAAVSSMEDLDAVVAPLKNRLLELNVAFEKAGGIGAAADETRAEMRALTGEIEAIIPSFASARQNLDFDGDKITWHADVATEAGRGLQTLADQAKGTGVAFENMLTNIKGKVAPEGKVAGIRGYGELFARTAKLREGPERAAVLAPQTAEMAGREAFAHVAPKKSVGLLTDMFNQMLLAITAGSQNLGEAGRAALMEAMQAINEGLGMKHGAGGVPTQFIEDMRKGQLGKISKGMDEGGEDFYGSLGKTNEAYREALKQGLRNADESAVRALQEQEGVQGDDLLQVIDQLVDKLDLKGSIKRMFDLMGEAMRTAMQTEGMAPGDIKAEMGAMMKPAGGGKGPPGFDLNRIMKNIFPAHTLTRGRFAKEIMEQPGMERIRKILSLFPEQLADEISELSTELDPGSLTGSSKQIAQQIHTALKSWLKTTYKELNKFQIADVAMVQKLAPGLSEKQAGKVKGVYKKGPKGIEHLGATFIGLETVMKPFAQALADLGKIARGVDIGRSINVIAEDLARLPAVFAHESIHRANKKFGTAVSNIMRQFARLEGPLGKSFAKLGVRMTEKVPVAGVVQARKRVEDLVGRQRGGKALTEQGKAIGPAIEGAQKNLRRVMAEELIAYQAEPAEFAKLVKGIPEAAITALKNEFEKVRKAEPELINAGIEAATLARKAMIDGLSSALEGKGPDVAGLQGEAAARVRERMEGVEFPGRLEHVGRRERLGLAETALAQGRQAMGIPEEMKLPPGMAGMEGLGQEVTELFGAMSEAVGDPGALRAIENKISSAGREYQSRIKGLQQQGEMPGVKGFVEAEQLTRQFRAQAAEMMIRHSKNLERNIAEMQAKGETEGPEFRDKLQEFQKSVERIFEFYASTLRPVGRGRGRTVSPIASMAGEMVPAAKQAGVTATPATYKAIMKQAAGEGMEADAFKHMMGPLERVKEAIDKGGEATEEWSDMWQELIARPQHFQQNMAKVVEVLSKFSKLAGAPGTRTSDELNRMAGFARQFVNAMKEEPPVKRIEDIQRIAGKTPRLTALAEKGRGGTLADSIDAQYKEAIAKAGERAKQLTKVIGTDAFKQLKIAGRDFEPMKMDIIDPKTGQVVQKLGATFKRVGKTIQVSMQQGGAAAGAFGNQMRNAFRRVVQWGFASGIIYGTIRALRNAVQVITEVQDKMMQLQKVMDVTITDFAAMQDGAVSMAKEFGISISEVLDGMVVYGQQGLKMAEITERTRATLLAVNVTTLSATDATEALTAAHKVFGETVSSSAEFVDAWGSVAARHAITAKDLADAVKRSGAAAGVSGTSFEDFLGIITAIGAVTRQTGKEIATSTKFMFRAMRRPVAQKEIGALGIRSLTETGDLRPAMDILKDLAGLWDGLSRAQQVNTAQAMAGIRHYNSFIVLMNNFDEALIASADATNSQGFAIRKNALAMKTFSKQMQVLRETVKGVALEVGKAILPAATTAVKIFSGLVDVVGKLPGPLQQVGIIGLAAMVGIHKGADLVLDSMDAIMGTSMKVTRQEKGLVGMMAGGVRDVGMGLFGGRAAMKGAGKMGTSARKLRNAFESVGSAAFGATPIISVFGERVKKASIQTRMLSGSMTKLAMGMRLLASTAIIGALIWGITALVSRYKAANKSGKEVADQLYNQIGQSKDAANQLRQQATQVQRLDLAYIKLQKSLEKLQDPEALQTALNSGNYKSASVAAQTYSNMVYEVGEAIATIDPARLRGITTSGQYIINIGKSMQGVTASAIDARNAITAAFQTDVIKAFANELKEPKGVIDKLSQAFNNMLGIETDFGALGKLKKAREELNKELKKREALASRGLIDTTGHEKAVELTKQELVLRQQVFKSSMEIKKILEEMPRFEDMGMAVQAMGPDFAEAIEAAIPSGVFGKGATLQSVMMKQLAKSAGIGGFFGYEAAKTPGLMAGTLAERGVRLRGGAGAVTPEARGEIGLATTEVARRIVESLDIAVKDADLAEITQNARVMISDINRGTGEGIYRFFDTVNDTYREAQADQVESIVAAVEAEQGKAQDKIVHAWIRATRKSMEDIAAETERILNLAFVGVMAGVRMPKGGMPDIGVARTRELTAEQRIIKALTADMERLGKIQAEMTQITNQYSEEVLGNVQEAYKTQAKSGLALKAMTEDMVSLVSQLQEEAFNISVVAHYQKAIEDLNVSLEQAAQVARDARIEEEARSEFLIETSGAMAGMAEVHDIDFGKVFREMTAGQKLSIEVPGFADFMRRMGSGQKEREALVGQLADIRKRRAAFEETMKDLSVASETLSESQRKKIEERAVKGLDPATQELLKSFESTGDTAESQRDSQLNVQTSMLDRLQNLVDIGLATPEKLEKLRNDIKTAQGATEVKKMLEQYGKVYGAEPLKELTLQALGVGVQAKERGPKFVMKQSSKILDELVGQEADKFKQALEDYVNILNAGVRAGKRAERRRKGAGGGPQGYLGIPLAEAEIGGETQAYETLQAVQKEQEGRLIKLLEFEKVRGTVLDESNKRTATLAQREKMLASKKEQHATRMEELKSATAAKAAEGIKRFIDAEMKTILSIEQGTKELLAKEPARIAIAARDLATGIDNIINEFKKAEFLKYEKIKSDLEGPFARVGRPGFKTEFEQKRSDLEAKRMRPMTMDEMKANNKELSDIDFDEKEARIKQGQDKETSALRLQQQQAERMRSVMADALFSGQLAGTGLQGTIKNFVDTLTSELATSEQAEMKGGKLTFRGVPSLQAAGKMAAEVRKFAQTKAAEARGKGFRAHITDPIVKQLQSGTTEIVAAVSRIAQGAGAPARAGAARQRITFGASPRGGLPATGPLAFGDQTNLTFPPQVGLTNRNQIADWQTRAFSGNATGSTSSIVNTRSAAGVPRAPGGVEDRTGGLAPGGQAVQTEAVQVLAQAVTSLETTLAGLTNLQLDTTSLETSIAVLGTEIVGAVQSDLSVNIINAPVVSVSNISEIGTAATAGIGADITTLGQRITELESDIGDVVNEAVSNLNLEQDITDASSAADAATETANTTNEALVALGNELRNADLGIEADIRLINTNAAANESRVTVNIEDIRTLKTKTEIATQVARVAANVASAARRV